MKIEEETLLLQYIAEKLRKERGQFSLADKIYQDVAVGLHLATTPQHFIYAGEEDQASMYKAIKDRLHNDYAFSALVRMLAGSIMNDISDSGYSQGRRDHVHE
jgi:hypothetical protein